MAVGAADRKRRRLLLFFCSAGHPSRDVACATLAWVAEAEGKLFECYYDARPTGSHFGGGLPTGGDLNDLRGGLFTGAHHLEQLLLVLERFDCEAVCLGESIFTACLAAAGVPMRSNAIDLAHLYHDIFETSGIDRPSELLVVGEGRCTGVSLTPFAAPEVVNRHLLAVAEHDHAAVAALSSGTRVQTIWMSGPPPAGVEDLRPEQTSSAAEETAWMADRWEADTKGFLLGDPELAGRWIPSAARNRWMAIHGVPQSDVISRLERRLRDERVVTGRQHDDRDFLSLSRLGVAFQLVDPGRPPFPVLREAPAPWPPRPTPSDALEPDDDRLRRWARAGRVVSTLLFWTGMARELENLYALADVLTLSGLAAGLVLSTESFGYMTQPPLTLVEVPAPLGGLWPRVEVLLGSAGAGAMIESAAPVSRFAETLRLSTDELAARLGGRDRLPRGWWPVMDAPLLPELSHRFVTSGRAPFVRARYRPRPRTADAAEPGRPRRGRSLRSRVRESPLGHFFEPIRPFTEFRPGLPRRDVLEAVRDAGFEYAFTASSFAGPPRVVVDVDGITSLTYTAGRWDGWTPFITVNGLSDLIRAERRLLAGRRPGWLVGTLDTCLWAFSGPVWERGRELHRMCTWMAGGGSSGRLVNVTPRVAARYARILYEGGFVEALESR